jgi:hypothetical protein
MICIKPILLSQLKKLEDELHAERKETKEEMNRLQAELDQAEKLQVF